MPDASREPAEKSGVAARSQLSRRDLLLLAGLIGGGAVASNCLQNSAPLARDVSSSLAAREALAATSARSDGNPSGDVRLVAFNDFLCPVCKLTAPELMSAVRADGNVRVEFIDLTFFGPIAEQAARVGLAVALQGRYASFHHEVMNERGQIDRARLSHVVQRIGANWSRAERDVKTHATDFTTILNKDAMLAFALGIDGTPAFLVGGLLAKGRLRENQFRGLFDQARTLTSQLRS
jgi:protein-disulfide isomerase